LTDAPIVRMVRARTYLRAAPAGGSQSFFIKADDGENYLLKRQTNPQGLHVLVNEIIGSTIARLMDAPVPESVLIEVELEFLAVAGLPPGMTTGLHFGCKEIHGLVGPVRNLIPDVSNTDQFVNVIASDAVLNNTDRNNPGNFVIREVSDSPRRLEFIAIDYGHSFGCAWDESIVNQSAWCGNFLPEMKPFVSGEHPFAGASKAATQIPQGTIDAVVNVIPPSWSLSVPKSTAIRQYLLTRLQTVDQLLESQKVHFPHWK
jgi:hypothetical protein